MAKTIVQLKAQGAEVKNATVVGENTATRVGTLFNDIVEHVEDYEAKQAEKLSELEQEQIEVYNNLFGKILYNQTITVAANTTRTDLDGNRLIGITIGMGDTITFVKSVNFPMKRLVIRNSKSENVLDVTADFSKGVKIIIPDTQFYYIIYTDSSDASREFELVIRNYSIDKKIEDNSNKIDIIEENVTSINRQIVTTNSKIEHQVLFESEQNVEANTYRHFITLPDSLKKLSEPKNVLVTGKSTGANKIIRFVVLNAISEPLYDSQTEYGLIDFAYGIKVTIPTHGVYAYFFYGSNVSKAQFSQTISMKIESTNEIYNIEKELYKITDTSIKTLNPKYIQFLANVAMGEKWMSTENNKPFVFAHISDIHGDSMYLKRYVDFCTDYIGTYIDEMIHTGDSVISNYEETDAFKFWDNNGAQKVLNIVGNHDLYDSNNTYAHNGLDAFNRYIKPYASYWGVVLPENAETNGYCYYYKDYTKGSERLRLIAIDLNGSDFDSTQQTWLENVLEDARQNGKQVVIMNHFIPDACIRFDSSFCTNAAYVGKLNVPALSAIVKNFIDTGGVFVCHLVGHLHQDFLGKIESDTRQLVIGIDKGGCNTRNGWGDSYRANGIKSGDCFNIMGVDTEKKLIKIARIGNDMDVRLRSKNTITIYYGITSSHLEPTIIYES